MRMEKGLRDVDCEIQQWAREVTDFSSQYGSDNSMSYTVSNIANSTSVYPEYGDFTQAAVLRTYGAWWKEAPSYNRGITHRVPSIFISEDFIELLFEQPVYPTRVLVYETYNPGAVVRILACHQGAQEDGLSSRSKTQWFVLWEGKPVKAPAMSRVFNPQPLNTCPFATNIIRLEFNSGLLDYYTELDGVELCGYPHQLTSPTPNNIIHTCLPTQPPIARGDDTLASLSVQECDSAETGVTRTEAITLGLVNLHIHDSDGLSAALDKSDNGFFDQLPEEVIQEVISFLDLPSLCRLASVSHLFYQHCYDSLQYMELSLQAYWHMVDDAALEGIASRCKHTQLLDLSWCGSLRAISSSTFSRFMLLTCKELVSLRLAHCNFVDNTAMKAICQQCLNLRELDIQGCRRVDNFGFVNITLLVQLSELNLYRTMIDIHSLTAIVRSCDKIEVLNLGSCSSVNNFNDIAVELALHCRLMCGCDRKLRCLDLWRARSLSDIGLSALAHHCPLLEELDLGWCSLLVSSSGCFVELFRKCPNLKKVFLTANRSVCDHDLESIINHCPLVEQLDILGTREVSQTVTQKLLDHCKHLKFLDISFCNNIDFATTRLWQQQYPDVALKKSYQNH